ncbi:hypothetical protein ABEB36_005854 [Hypothenemus hampei]|uniref:Uncharacterized protein n=1 Tax=Hypothenemus hampei TaxID=57062 RepID=A0ABD1F028_HYPHA
MEVADFGLPERDAVSMLARSRLKSETYAMTVINDGEDSPNVDSSFSLISHGDRSLMRKYFITLGRLYQVEYATEAAPLADTRHSILANAGILLTAECQNTNKLLDEDVTSEKIFKLNE